MFSAYAGSKFPLLQLTPVLLMILFTFEIKCIPLVKQGKAICAFLTWDLIVEHKHIRCLSSDYIGSQLGCNIRLQCLYFRVASYSSQTVFQECEPLSLRQVATQFFSVHVFKKCFMQLSLELLAGLSLKKTPHMWLPRAKRTFYGYGMQFLLACHNIIACDLREIKYW